MDEIRCPQCNGRGKYWFPTLKKMTQCEKCRGTGKIQSGNNAPNEPGGQVKNPEEIHRTADCPEICYECEHINVCKNARILVTPKWSEISIEKRNNFVEASIISASEKCASVPFMVSLMIKFPRFRVYYEACGNIGLLPNGDEKPVESALAERDTENELKMMSIIGELAQTMGPVAVKQQIKFIKP